MPTMSSHKACSITGKTFGTLMSLQVFEIASPTQALSL